MIPLDAMPVPLANGRGWAWVDPIDWEAALSKKWFLNQPGQYSSYAQTNLPRNGASLRKLYLHRFVAERLGMAGGQVDHEDRDGLNCTRGNLRPATQSQQLANQRVRKDSKSGFRGVQATGKGTWRARIKIARKTRTVATCARTAESAARIYDAWAVEVYGPFASLNFKRSA